MSKTIGEDEPLLPATSESNIQIKQAIIEVEGIGVEGPPLPSTSAILIEDEALPIGAEALQMDDEALHIEDEALHIEDEALHIEDEASHVQGEVYMCQVCLEEFTIKDDLRLHLLAHPSPSASLFSHTCGVCQIRFKYKSQYRMHMANHSVRKTHWCESCDKHFTGEAHLIRHNNIHLKVVRSFDCYSCAKCFDTKDQFLEHMDAHKTGKVHECEICGKHFRFKSHLAVHMRKNTGAKPHQCGICRESFKIHCQRTEHMRVHGSYDAAQKRYGQHPNGGEHVGHMHSVCECGYCDKKAT